MLEKWCLYVSNDEFITPTPLPEKKKKKTCFEELLKHYYNVESKLEAPKYRNILSFNDVRHIGDTLEYKGDSQRKNFIV